MKEMPELTAKVAAYEQTLKDYQIFDQVSIPTPRIPSITDPPAPRTPVQPTQTTPTNKFLTVEDANMFGNNLLSLVKKVNKIQNDHQRLFGQPLEDDLIEHFIQTGA